LPLVQVAAHLFDFGEDGHPFRQILLTGPVSRKICLNARSLMAIRLRA